jgi:hypothetical protein
MLPPPAGFVAAILKVRLLSFVLSYWHNLSTDNIVASVD